jgi:hypothetical protein
MRSPPVLANVAASKGFPKYNKLKSGPQTRTERLPRRLKSGGTADIYEAILLALAKLGPKEQTSYDELRGALKDLLEEGHYLRKMRLRPRYLR